MCRSRLEELENQEHASHSSSFFLPKLGGPYFRRRKLASGNKREPGVSEKVRCRGRAVAERGRPNGLEGRKEKEREEGRDDDSHVCVCVRGSEDSVRSLSGYNRLSALLPSGNSSATSRASRRLHCTAYAAEHYITENDEPRVQSPGTLASSTCVMRRAQRAAASASSR